MSHYTCYRCNADLDHPVEEHAYYVRAADTVEERAVEVAEAIVHTEETRAAIEDLRDRHYPGRDVQTLTRAVVSRTDMIDYLGTPTEDRSQDPPEREENARAAAPAVADFDRVEVQNVADAAEGTVRVERRVEQREVQKTGLVCPDCHDPETDEVIWGPSSA